MPSKPRPYEKRMLSLFLSRYQDGAWATTRADYDWCDEREDGAVELVASRYSDGSRLAIEHTLIQPFPTDIEDCHQFKPLLDLQNDETLSVSNRLIYIDVPVGTVQKGYETANLRELRDWLDENRLRLPLEHSEQRCPFSGRPSMVRILRVRVVSAPGHKGMVIVRRYGERSVDATVRKALCAKLPKLLATDADRRVLMLEHRAFSVDDTSIRNALEREASTVAGATVIDETWCVETVPSEDILRFTHQASGGGWSDLTFAGGRLLSEIDEGAWSRPTDQTDVTGRTPT